MDKVGFIVSALLSNEGIQAFLWWIVGFGAVWWPQLYLIRHKRLTEEELRKISPSYAGIESEHYLWRILWLLAAGLPSFVVGWWFTLEKTLRIDVSFLMALLTLVYATSGMAEGMFAVRRGVYPVGRGRFFVYDDGAYLRRLGKIEVISGTVVTIASVVFVCMKLLRYDVG